MDQYKVLSNAVLADLIDAVNAEFPTFEAFGGIAFDSVNSLYIQALVRK